MDRAAIGTPDRPQSENYSAKNDKGWRPAAVLSGSRPLHALWWPCVSNDRSDATTRLVVNSDLGRGAWNEGRQLRRYLRTLPDTRQSREQEWSRMFVLFAGSCSVAAVAAPLLSPSAQADEAFEGPKFRRGEWHFVRTPRGHDAGEGQDSPA